MMKWHGDVFRHYRTLELRFLKMYSGSANASAEEYLAYTTEETEKVEVYRLAEKLGDDIEAAIRQLAERRRNKE